MQSGSVELYVCLWHGRARGYQFVGRTTQMWSRYRQNANFEQGKPWLLRFFDQIRFYEVSETELMQMREDFKAGRYNCALKRVYLI
jgi:allophanate hydrolase subunit 1